MTSTFKKYDRVVCMDHNMYKNCVGTIKSATKKGRLSVTVRHANHQLITHANSVVKIDIHQSIPDGVKITDCCVRPFRVHPNQYLPRNELGNVFKIAFFDECGVTLQPEHTPQSYWVKHECYNIVPNYKMAWVLKDCVLFKETVSFNSFTGDYVIWQTEDGEQVKDKLVHNNITNALDYARKFKQHGPIKVIR